jgi:adenine-specific DNA-methyltransferase
VSRLNDLLRELRSREPALARDLEREVAALAERRAFGLNFERHVPEAVELPGRKVRKGDKVRILPPRGQMTKKSDEKLWRAVGIDRSAGTATLEPLAAPAPDLGELLVDEGEARLETRTAALDDLVVVAEFRDPIYPGLVSTGKVERGGDKPFHTVINAENFHALQTLLFTHRGKVDCIYIDPPYNTGAKDWKYNNDYVEGDDLYRHSKWLAFMERRLLLAKELLNPADSVLVVTIDEEEYLRLGLLLEQTFPEGTLQMVSSVTNRKGSARAGGFSRVDEYIYFVRFGVAQVLPTSIDVIGLGSGISKERLPDIWNQLMRRGSNSARSDRPTLFYPIYVDPVRSAIAEIGKPLGADQRRSEAPDIPGLDTVLPMRSTGEDGRWSVGRDTLRALLADGYVKVGNKNPTNGLWTINYLISKDIQRLKDGEIVSSGKDENGAHILDYLDVSSRLRTPKTIWNLGSHDATEHGKTFLTNFLGGRTFPFPKSLYAVEDTLRFVLKAKPNATVLDFFSGSGTTAHALMRLNKQDGGRRVAISVTNNEVAADEHKDFRKKGLRPGDSEWERWGICEYITKPRIEAAISGKSPDGDPIKGEYKFTDEFPMADGFEDNVEFFTLTYEAPLRVASNREFAKIAPLLWLRAGSRGRRIEDISAGWDVADVYGVLANLDHTEDFLKAVAANRAVAIAYIVTDEDRLFESVSQELPEHVEPVRLYEAYLRNFEIESGRGSL